MNLLLLLLLLLLRLLLLLSLLKTVILKTTVTTTTTPNVLLLLSSSSLTYLLALGLLEGEGLHDGHAGVVANDTCPRGSADLVQLGCRKHESLD